jgi:hypothetical protein
MAAISRPGLFPSPTSPSDNVGSRSSPSTSIGPPSITGTHKVTSGNGTKTQDCSNGSPTSEPATQDYAQCSIADPALTRPDTSTAHNAPLLIGFDILTYRKEPCPREPRSAFSPHLFVDDLGREHHFLLADRSVRLPYDAKKKRFACRQITRLHEESGHQTQIVTTRNDPSPALVAYSMFSRWRQEIFFRYMRAHFALDAYETVPDDPDRLVANPARRRADRTVREARQSFAEAEAKEDHASLTGRPAKRELPDAFVDARVEIDRLADHAKTIPTKVAVTTIRPDAVRIDVERKRIMDAIRMATYNAESAPARLAAPHYARADDEARTLQREIFKSPADLQIIGNQMHVCIYPLSAPRRTRALAGLCQELTDAEANYPGTELTLIYSVKEA